MNKNDIKKALKCCADVNSRCKICPYYMEYNCNDILCEDALTLIIEQEKEIEILKKTKKR